MARIMLMNGCSVSTPSVFPRNWQEGGKELLEIDWRIQYYYHDPDYTERWPRGKLCIVKGMNEYKTLTERRAATKTILQDEVEEMRRGWNPARKTFMVDSSIEYGALHPNLPFIDAFRMALERSEATDRHKYYVAISLDRLEKSARKLRMQNIPIDQLKRRELKQVMHHVGFPAKYFNHVKGYLSSLFTELIEEDCCDVNLARDIRKRKTLKEQREILSKEELEAVMMYLKPNYYSFWRYAQIFMFSGARSSELMALKRCDIDLDEQEFTVTIKKGRQHKRVKKVILTEVLHLWREACEGAGPKDYIFSKGLVPGKEKVRNDQITIRWRRNVKKSDKIVNEAGEVLKITADFYALKHAMLDSLPIETAQKLASHTNIRTTAIYQVNKEKRDREELKKLRVVS